MDKSLLEGLKNMYADAWIQSAFIPFPFFIPCKHYAKVSQQMQLKCTCGSDAIKGLAGHHSDWCSKYTGNWKFNYE